MRWDHVAGAKKICEVKNIDVPRDLNSAVRFWALLHGTEDEATLAKGDLEDELYSLRDRLTREVELRKKEAKEFSDRLAEVHCTSLSAA